MLLGVDDMTLSKEELLFGKQKVFKTLLKIAPPLMIAQLIQALYNIVDSLFVGHYSDSALSALSIIYPYQYIAIALSIMIGVGVNTFMAKQLALNDEKKSDNTVFVGAFLSVICWVLFAVISIFLIKPYVTLMSKMKPRLMME